MGKNNLDVIIDELLVKIQKGKEELKNITNVKYETNLSFQFEDGKPRINLNVNASSQLIVDILSFLINKEKSYNEACDRLNVTDLPFKYMNYTTAQWEHDLKIKLELLKFKEKESTLKKMEDKLNTLLSPEQIRQREIELLKKELENM